MLQAGKGEINPQTTSSPMPNQDGATNVTLAFFVYFSEGYNHCRRLAYILLFGPRPIYRELIHLTLPYLTPSPKSWTPLRFPHYFIHFKESPYHCHYVRTHRFRRLHSCTSSNGVCTCSGGHADSTCGMLGYTLKPRQTLVALVFRSRIIRLS